MAVLVVLAGVGAGLVGAAMAALRAVVPAARRGLRMAVLVVLAGVGAGLVGAAMAALLLLVEAVTYGQASGSLLEEVESASDLRRVIGPLVGGALAGGGWWWLRRRVDVHTVEDALTDEAPRLPLRRTVLDALLQILVVGSGASIGREGAPRQASAALADALSSRFEVSAASRRAVMAAAAGAGLAAVYNVPLAGAVFALETLPVRRDVRAVLIAAAMSGIATVVAWPVVTSDPTYRFPVVTPTPEVVLVTLAWTGACVPAAALVGAAFHRLARWARGHPPAPGWRLPLFVGGASALVGVASIALPALPGNGKDILQLAYSTHAGLSLFAVLLIVKPVATALCLRSGAVGGLLTPALATGGALGAVVASPLGAYSGGVVLPVFALLGAAGVLAVTQRAPLFGAVMAWELAHAPLWTAPFVLLTAFGARHLARAAALGRRALSARLRSTEEPPVA